MSTLVQTKVLVVGGGPGGYVAAVRCGQLGLDTVLVEQDRLGGTCLIRGCIPSKALIHAAGEFDRIRRAADHSAIGLRLDALPRIDFAQTAAWQAGVVDRLNGGVAGLLKRAGVRVVSGWARFTDGKTCEVATAGEPIVVQAEHVILANRSVPIALPALPFGGAILSSTEALALTTLPNSLAVVGAGYIGLELGIAFRKLGVAVTVVEAAGQILPHFDPALVEPVARWLKANGVALHLNARAETWDDGHLHVTGADGTPQSVPCEKVLVTVGRRAQLEGWGLDQMAVATDGGFIRVDDRCATTMHNVWAIGDLVGEPMLAHKASAQGEMVAEIIAGARRRFDPVAIAAVCYTEPEIVSVGLDPARARARGAEPLLSTFPFSHNGRALTMEGGHDGGFVRVVAEAGSQRVLGIQAVGLGISELAGEFSLALEMGAVLGDVAGTIHPHPTLGEAFIEAALAGVARSPMQKGAWR